MTEPHARPRLKSAKGRTDAVRETEKSSWICWRAGAMIDAANVLVVEGVLAVHDTQRVVEMMSK